MVWSALSIYVAPSGLTAYTACCLVSVPDSICLCRRVESGNETTIYILALSHCPGIGPIGIGEVVRRIVGNTAMKHEL